MNIKKIYITNMLFSSIYLITILLTTLVSFIYKNMNPNNMVIRTTLCFLFSIIMFIISFEKIKNVENIHGKYVNSSMIKIGIIFYYIYIVFSCVLYVYETISVTETNGAYIMPLGAMVMLNAINNSILRVNFN